MVRMVDLVVGWLRVGVHLDRGRILGRRSGFVSFHMSPEAVFVRDIANLSEHSVFIFVAITSLYLMRLVALLLFPLLVALMINHLVTIFIWVILILFEILLLLCCSDTMSQLIE